MQPRASGKGVLVLGNVATGQLFAVFSSQVNNRPGKLNPRADNRKQLPQLLRARRFQLPIRQWGQV